MVLTYENLLTLADFNVKAAKELTQLNSHNFLSFQDALHYLIKAHSLQGKKILLPAFYCEATVHDMEAHGLHVEFCELDQQKFDVDINDFMRKLQTFKPDIVLIYNFFGKNSLLYNDLAWKKYLKADSIIISDFAHSFVSNHTITFINAKHFYIDSTRKSTCRMMANLIMPQGFELDHRYVVKQSIFRYSIRFLYFIKSWCLRLATRFNLPIFSTLGMQLYILHDKYIGSPKNAFSGFWWDCLLYQRIKFKKINNHRRELYNAYRLHLHSLADEKHIELFDLPLDEEKNLCFFFVRVMNASKQHALLQCLQQAGFWVDTLWDFDAIKNISAKDREWAKSIIVLPYTLRTKSSHVEKIAMLMRKFYKSDE